MYATYQWSDVTLKGQGTAADMAVLHRWGGGLTWMAYPDEPLQRASHALTGGGDVWLVDPVDADGLDEAVAELGTVAGVVVLSSFHRRDAGPIAERHGVPAYVPSAVRGVAGRLDVPVERFEGTLPGTGFRAISLWRFPWSEAALYHPDRRTLVVQEGLSTSEHLTAPGERLAVSPYVRLFPPRSALGGLAVERVLVGHGPGVLEDAQSALDAALADARRGAPAAIRANARYLVRAAYEAVVH